MNEPINQAINSTSQALSENSDAHWILGFSGGKDSTALLKIFASAAKESHKLPTHIDVIYCDTGVENPILDKYVRKLFKKLRAESKDQKFFRFKFLKAPVENRFFVKIIGRGYPPPTNSFRWCTNNLRIRPVSQFIRQAATGKAIVSLGMRRTESEQRNRSLERGGGNIWQTQVEAGRRYQLFLPIINFDIFEVWDAVHSLPTPKAIDADALTKIYRGASGECPMIKAPEAAPCASGRFGCWTCTVVRKDKSAESLISAGYDELRPYLEFRNWLADIRNDPDRRWPQRRTGNPGLGPFTLAARKEILQKLMRLEKAVATVLLPKDEKIEIQRLWKLDKGIEPK